ncbi:VWA domain-containing protein, partial [bacterium]|nr:VWA domain-containing protein [bacterium]
MLSTNGKASLAVLGILVGASALGILPIGQFFWRTAPAPRIEPLVKPVPPLVEPLPPVVLVKPPVGPVVVVNTASPGGGRVRAGAITVEGVLGQSKLVYGQDGTVYVDVKVTGDEAKGDSERRPVDLALVLDVSGSMSGENKITLMREACRRLAPQLTSGDRVAVIAFSTDARV